MMAGFDIEKSDPADVVRTALDGVEAGGFEVLADDRTRHVKASLAGDPRESYGPLHRVPRNVGAGTG
jgi:hypothetical protein